MLLKLKALIKRLFVSRILLYFVLLTIVLFIPTYIFSRSACLGMHTDFLRFSSLIASMTLAALIVVVLPRRAFILHPIILIIYTTFLFVNSVYCREFYMLIPLSMYSQASNLLSMDSSNVTNLLLFSDILVYALVLLGIYLLVKLQRLLTTEKRDFKSRLIVFALFIFGVLRFSGSSYDVIKTANWRLTNPKSQLKTLSRYPIPVVFSIRGVETFKARELSNNERAEAIKRLQSIAAENIAEVENITNGDRNLIVILIESLTSKGITKESMPFCYSLSTDSTNIFIPHIEHNIGVGVSMDGQMITLSGQKPLRDVFLYRINPLVKLPSVQKSLRKSNNQYKTKLITITDTLFWSQPLAARAVGINSLMGSEAGKTHHNESSQAGGFRSSWLSDEELFGHLINNIKTIPSNTPYIYTVITGDSHCPFSDSREPLHEITTYATGEEMYHYYISLQHTDREIKRLFTYLENEDKLNNTTILIASDHSAQIGDSDGRDMQMLLCNPINHSSYRPRRTPQQISIYPTLLWAMGVVDSTYMGLTPPMTSPRIEEFDDEKFQEACYLSELIQYNNLLAE